ncbi:helix-turn-helix domain-containing protein [Streptomyces goshikiensis]|uniref:helix-turn-helix domain-containing protein n=1 Tax=Streptomyces goshikiensis TaxID=1942 RepID=UPI0036BC7489
MAVTAGWDMAREVIPREYLAEGEWPSGELAADAPPGAHLGQALAKNLAAAMTQRGLSVRELARRAQATHPTVKSVLDGTRLPATHTVLLLESALGLPLYPARLFEQLQPPVGD